MKTDKLPDLINAASDGGKVFPTFQPLIHEEDPPYTGTNGDDQIFGLSGNDTLR